MSNIDFLPFPVSVLFFIIVCIIDPHLHFQTAKIQLFLKPPKVLTPFLFIFFALLQFEQFIAGTDLGGDGDGDTGALLGDGNGTVVIVNLRGRDVDDTCGGTCDKHLVAHLEGVSLNGKLSHAKL